ncbi:hypothetical protein TRAPUB_4061 [Trametes pubescens]|uniref:Uncharacterized protein n=1 Tax=Trametes pubescens TaxID=154538 RepID=A0A1M2VC54_TRAPU|nr:hypothetical protein TRAPUB_4061 [Trametes pubescens]
MIFETFVGGEHRSWLARISTLCKALMPDVEAALYRQTAVFSWNTTLLCHALIKRPYLALAVRSLIVLCTDGCAGIKQPLKSAFQLLTSLIRLELIVDDPSIFASLLGAPFRLRILLAGGHHYPACFEAILASQPSLELLVLFFTTGLMEHPRGRSACMLFDAIPVLWCLRIYGYEEFAGTDTIAEVFTRAEDKTCKVYGKVYRWAEVKGWRTRCSMMRSPRRCAVRRLVRESKAVAFAGSFVIPRTRKSQPSAIPWLTTRGIDAFSSFSRRARST